MELNNNVGCFWSTLRDLKLCIHSCIPSESVHVWVHRRPQTSWSMVLRAYEEVTLVKDIVIDIRQIADMEHSEIYKTTADTVNTAGTVTAISI